LKEFPNIFFGFLKKNFRKVRREIEFSVPLIKNSIERRDEAPRCPVQYPQRGA